MKACKGFAGAGGDLGGNSPLGWVVFGVFWSPKHVDVPINMDLFRKALPM